MLIMYSIPTALLFGFWLTKLMRLHRGVATAREYWSQPLGDEGGLLYVALGDSAAQGIGASRPDLGYVGLLAGRMHEATGKPVRVINLSVSGATVASLIAEQIPRLAGLSPDVITVAIGGNDIRSYEAVSFEQNARKLVASLPAGTFLADAPYFMHGRWERHAQQAAGILNNLGMQKGLAMVGLHVAERREGWMAMLTEFAADWFHPNNRGYRVWADSFWRSIEATLLDASEARS